jgi:CHAT domain-containing protein
MVMTMVFKKTFKTWVAFFFSVSVFIMVGSGQAAGQSAGEEEKLILQCDGLIKRQYPVLKDEALIQKFQKLVQTLSDRPLPNLKITILNDPVPNIFSLPDHLYLTTGLLDLLESKDELAYLLARELSCLGHRTPYKFFEAELNKKRTIRSAMTFLNIASLAASVATPFVKAANVSALGTVQATPSVLAAQVLQLGMMASAGVAGKVGQEAFASHAEALKTEMVLENQISALKRQSLLAFQKGQREAGQRLKEEAGKLTREREKFIQELQQKNPRYAAICQPQPVTPTQVPLASGEYLLRYKVTDAALLAWLVKDGGLVQAVRVPVSRETLRQKVQQYLAPLHEVRTQAQLERYDPALAKELYDLLLKPLAPQISGVGQLVIITDDILEVLPFESLVIEAPARVEMAAGQFGPQPRGLKYVADQFKVSYYYSATSLKLMRQARIERGPSSSLFMMADPGARGSAAGPQGEVQRRLMSLAQKGDWRNLQDQFKPLPYTMELAEKLKVLFPDARILVGTEANKQNLTGIEKHRYLVFATHGILAKELPYLLEPALLLAGESGPPEELRPRGFLTMSDVMKLELNCDNATLTACSTGLGRRASGEGVMSLGWAFQYAGAKSVLVSLWKVEEKSTILLANQFFEKLKAGKDKLTALHEARAELRRQGYEHPFYWASFILIGEKI